MKFSKNVLPAIAAIIISASFTIGNAEAARMGGGKSFGMSRNTSQPAAPKPAPTVAPSAAPAAAAAAAAAAPRSGMNRWLGPIAGLAAGIGLMSLMSHLGMGEGMGNFLMIALLVMAAVFLFRFLTRKRQPEAGLQYAGAGFGQASAAPLAFEAQKVGAGGTALAEARAGNEATSNTGAIPADFDVAGFVRQAKLNFVRLQAANDRGDLDDIRQFTAPEVFAEIQLQVQERGKTTQQTDVVHLEAELLGVSTEEARHIASVRFFGQMREDTHGAPQAFAEIWHLAKPIDGSRGWQIAGIQQLS